MQNQLGTSAGSRELRVPASHPRHNHSMPRPSAITIGPGAFHLPGFLSLDEQRALTDDCRALVDGAVPAYVPIVRGGGRMHVRMLCLGRHWNGQRYAYEPTRSDFDG